jgi:hypothetical protein
MWAHWPASPLLSCQSRFLLFVYYTLFILTFLGFIWNRFQSISCATVQLYQDIKIEISVSFFKKRYSFKNKVLNSLCTFFFIF